MKRIAWITCHVLPEPDADEALALAALRAAGCEVTTVAWDAPTGGSVQGFDLAVLRSCWNYFEEPAGFRSWVRRADEETRLLNGAGVVGWNVDKGYLEALARRAVPIVPTVWLRRGELTELAALVQARGWGDVVVKPTISAGSFCTRRFRSDDVAAGQGFLDRALVERDMLVQEYVPSVETSGERALVWIDGAFTHTVVKAPRFDDDDESVSGAEAPLADELALGEAALAAACADGGFDRDELFYARVDTVEHGGRRVLSELELLEPSLFLLQSPPALERFVARLVARA